MRISAKTNGIIHRGTPGVGKKTVRKILESYPGDKALFIDLQTPGGKVG